MISQLQGIISHLLRALDFGWVVRVVGIDGEGEHESTTLVHACTVPQ